MKKKNRELISKLSIVAIPIMLQNLVQSGLGFLDTLMIGQLGEAEVAAIGGANQFFFFLQLILGKLLCFSFVLHLQVP